jgi:hypothetical protein
VPRRPPTTTLSCRSTLCLHPTNLRDQAVNMLALKRLSSFGLRPSVRSYATGYASSGYPSSAKNLLINADTKVIYQGLRTLHCQTRTFTLTVRVLQDSLENRERTCLHIAIPSRIYPTGDLSSAARSVQSQLAANCGTVFHQQFPRPTSYRVWD